MWCAGYDVWRIRLGYNYICRALTLLMVRIQATSIENKKVKMFKKALKLSHGHSLLLLQYFLFSDLWSSVVKVNTPSSHVSTRAAGRSGMCNDWLPYNLVGAVVYSCRRPQVLRDLRSIALDTTPCPGANEPCSVPVLNCSAIAQPLRY